MTQAVAGVQVLAPVTPAQAEILSPDALKFVATLHRSFNQRRKSLLHLRDVRHKQIDSGHMPNFLPETQGTLSLSLVQSHAMVSLLDIRNNPTWKAAPPAPGLVDRRVEITGPVDRKMVINALNSGATQFMADFEGPPYWLHS